MGVYIKRKPMFNCVVVWKFMMMYISIVSYGKD